MHAIEPFARYYDASIGVKGKINEPQPLTEVAQAVEKAIGHCRALLAFGPGKVQSIGVVSGSTTDPQLFRELKVQEIRSFITGEPKHGAYYLAQEWGLNIFYGGHYLTETFGMKALGEHLEKDCTFPQHLLMLPAIFRALTRRYLFELVLILFRRAAHRTDGSLFIGVQAVRWGALPRVR